MNLITVKTCNLSVLFEHLSEAFQEHSKNVALYTVAMLRLIQEKHIEIEDAKNLSFHAVYKACRFHDIGKILIPASIIEKAGPLDELERMVVEEHPRLGSEILEEHITDSFLPLDEDERGISKILAYHHHERWDGKGYPNNVAGTDIPFIARLCSIADTFDAMTSDRPYRKGESTENALRVLDVVSGTQLDNHLVSLILDDTSWVTAANEYKMRDYLG